MQALLHCMSLVLAHSCLAPSVRFQGRADAVRNIRQ